MIHGRFQWLTNRGYEQFLHFVRSSRQFHLGSVLRVVDGDQHVKFFVQMFPVRFASILLLLQYIITIIQSDLFQ